MPRGMAMPTISRFYGLTIYMYANDHTPPHFHVEYGEFEAMIGISPVALAAGELPARARSLIMEWAAMHRQELLLNWERCRNGQAPVPVPPLD